MKRYWVGVLMLGLAALPAKADEASKRAKVEELFTVMHVSQMSDQIVAAVQKQMQASLHSRPGMDQLTPDQTRVVNEYEGKIMTLVNNSVSWKVLEPDMVNLYATTYSESEIEGILAFYKGPVGQVMLAKSPELTQKSMQISRTRLGALQPQITAMMDDFTKQFAAAAGQPATKPAPDTKQAPAPAPH